jgi:two-component system chemotaxis response regulator CheY
MFPDTTKILLVDDSQVARDILVSHLKKIGFTNLLAAGNGQEALEVLAREQSGPDPIGLVITDIVMPRMSGTDLVARLRSDEAYKTLPVVVHSVESEKKTILDAVLKGCNGYMIKPVNPRTLQSQLSQVWKLTSSDQSREDVA